MPAALRASAGYKRLISGSGRGYALLGRRRRVPCSGGLLRGGTARAIHVERALGARPMPCLIAEGKPRRQPAGGPQSSAPPGTAPAGAATAAAPPHAACKLALKWWGVPRAASQATPPPPRRRRPAPLAPSRACLGWAPFQQPDRAGRLEWPVCRVWIVVVQQGSSGGAATALRSGGPGRQLCARESLPTPFGALPWACCCNRCYARHCFKLSACGYHDVSACGS